MVGTKQSNGGTEAEKGEQRIRESVDYCMAEWQVDWSRSIGVGRQSGACRSMRNGASDVRSARSCWWIGAGVSDAEKLARKGGAYEQRAKKNTNFFGQPYIRALPTTIRGEPEFGQRAAEQMSISNTSLAVEWTHAKLTGPMPFGLHSKSKSS